MRGGNNIPQFRTRRIDFDADGFQFLFGPGGDGAAREDGRLGQLFTQHGDCPFDHIDMTTDV